MIRLSLRHLLLGLAQLIFFFSTSWSQEQLSTAKRIEADQKDCYDGLSDYEKSVIFPSPAERRKLFEQVFRKLDRGGLFMSPEKKKQFLDSMDKVVLNSPYQDVSGYLIISNVLQDALPLCKKYNVCPVAFNPKFATIHCPTINADCRKINNEFVLYVNGKLITFFYQINKSIIESIGIDLHDTAVSVSLSRSEMIRKIRDDTALQQRFIRQLEYAYYGRPYKDYIPPEKYDPFISGITHYMELFIVCHELVHAAKKHDPLGEFSYSGNETYNAEDSLIKKRQTATQWSYEISADYYAQHFLNLYATSLQKDNFSDMAKLGGLLYLTYDDVYQKAVTVFETGRQPEQLLRKDLQQINNIVNLFTNRHPSDSLVHVMDYSWTAFDHPPNRLRSAVIAEIVEKSISPATSRAVDGKTQAGFFTVGKHLISAIEYLYSVCEPQLIKIANEKKQQ